MNISYKKIFGIILTSSFLGLIFNYINPSGVPLIREKSELRWAPDSLFLDVDNNNLLPGVEDPENIYDNEKNTASNNELIKEKQPDVIVTEESNQTPQKEKIEADTDSKEISEPITFSEPQAITLSQAYTLFKRNVLFIDARDEADYLAGHIAKSVNIPFDDFDNHKSKLESISKEKPVVIYCAGTECDLSILLGNLLFSQGYKQVYVFFGGWGDWVNANYPIEYPSEQKNE